MVNELFDKIINLTKSRIKKRYGPEKKEQKRSSLDFSKIEKAIGWKLKYSLDEGLKKTIDWFKNRT